MVANCFSLVDSDSILWSPLELKGETNQSMGKYNNYSMHLHKCCPRPVLPSGMIDAQLLLNHCAFTMLKLEANEYCTFQAI